VSQAGLKTAGRRPVTGRSELDRVPVFVLCGGLGTRLKEETEFRPKPMVPIGDRPILWHIMRLYARHGFRRFVLCLGFKAPAIKSYFLDYSAMNSDLTIELTSNEVSIHSVDHDDDWTVTLADTGEGTMTGSRIARAAARYLGPDDRHFAVTYGDGLTDADLALEYEFHVEHGRTGTVLGINPPSRFGELVIDGSRVTDFDEKPHFEDSWINGGFFFFSHRFLDYLSADGDCVLERAPLRRLTEDGELRVYRHRGFWACMDTQRDREELNRLWDSGEPPWVAAHHRPVLARATGR
jgi:glucose-1-phosphate cytidylyltransferase